MAVVHSVMVSRFRLLLLRYLKQFVVLVQVEKLRDEAERIHALRLTLLQLLCVFCRGTFTAAFYHIFF